MASCITLVRAAGTKSAVGTGASTVVASQSDATRQSRSCRQRKTLLDLKFLELVAQGPEGDAQVRGGAGLVVAAGFQRLADAVALDAQQFVGQGRFAAFVGVAGIVGPGMDDG